MNLTITIACIWFCGLAIMSYTGPAQQLADDLQFRPEIEIKNTKVAIGKPIHIAIRFAHPPEWDLLFVDSTYQFTPFEFLEKVQFPTKTYNNISVDSINYRLLYFDDKDTVSLALPLIVRTDRKTDTIYTDAVKLEIQKLLTELPKKPEFKENTKFVEMTIETDAIFLAWVIGLPIVIIATLSFIFRKKIRQQYQLYKLKRKNISFLLNYDQLIYNHLDKEATQKSIVLWKSYISHLKSMSLLPLSSREVSQRLKKPEIYESLSQLDAFIYGGIVAKNLKENLELLKSMSSSYYQERVNQIKGKA